MPDRTPLDELTGVTSADVWKGDRVVARLHRLADRTELRYVADGPQVGLAYPVRDEPYVSPAASVPALLANLLPEGRRLTALRRAVRTSVDDEFSLLLAVGGDLVGDLRVSPRGEPPVTDAPVLDGDASEVRFADVTGLGDQLRVERRGLAGVQPKVSAALVSLAVRDASRAGRPAILKLDVPEFPGLVRNEAVIHEAARRAGLETPEVREVADADGHAGLLVERFDRAVTATGVQRLAQEDGCQVLARWPGDKYRLGVEEVLAGMTAHAVPRPVVALDLVRQVAFAVLTGNGDQHAKNLSLLRDGTRWRASPAYDLPTTHPYGDPRLALPLLGSTGDPPRRSFLALGEHLGLQTRAVERMLDQLVDGVDRWIDLADELPFDRRRRDRWRAFVRNRRRLLAGGG